MTNSTHNLAALGQQIRAARETKSLSIRDVAEQAGMGRSTLLDLEQGRVASPNPTSLSSLAKVLELRLADLYTTVGYTPPADLPAFTPYLRSKYGDLPAEAQDEISESFEHIAKKYGYDANGPAPGQDE